MTRNKRKSVMFLNLLLGMLLLLSGCAPGAQEGPAKEEPNAGAETKGNMVIGLNNWAENIAVSNMWALLLQEKGYNVELKPMEKSPLWIGLSQGDVDLSLETWLPTTDQPLMDKYKDKIEVHEIWYKGTGLGLVVPTYVDINSIDELNANKDKFQVNGKPSIVGIEPGSSLMRMTDQAAKDYGLDMEVISGSEAMMISALGKAIDKKEPIVVTLWNPHWAFAKYDLKYLEDPKKVYGEADNIHYFSRLGFAKDYPEVTKWMDQWEMDDQSLGSLMAIINESDTPEAGAKKWIEDNRELVDQWLK